MPSEKPIITISIAAKLLKLHPRTLMLYEHSELVEPYRTATNRRLYSAKDLADLQFVKYLTQKERVNLRGVKIVLDVTKLVEKKGINLKKLLFPTFKARPLV